MTPRAAPPAPLVDADSIQFWEAADRGELRLCHCTACGTYLQPPLERCKRCGAGTHFVPAAGTGTIYSFIVVHHPSVPAFADKVPYVLAIVELDEGIRLPGLLLDETGPGVAVAQPVQAEIIEIAGAPHAAVAFRRAPTG
jgi:uncharacterized OB-fold protein